MGKTCVLKEFSRRYYGHAAYFNFDENKEYKQFFETTKDVNWILQNLMMTNGQRIVPEKTLIIFNEMQDCSNVINFMKHFCENAPQWLADLSLLRRLAQLFPVRSNFGSGSLWITRNWTGRG